MHERDVENVLEQLLISKGWIADVGKKARNVYRQQPKFKEEKALLGSKRPDFILYDSKERPIAIIETKKSSHKKIEDALMQAVNYAELLSVNIVFVFSKNIFISYHLKTKASLYIDEQEVTEFLPQETLEKFETQNTNSVFFSEKAKINSRRDLISVFEYANKQLRSAGITIGFARFAEFANLLFLKLVSEKDSGFTHNIPEYISWDTYKNKTGDELLNYINEIVIPKLDEIFQNNESDTIFQKMKIKNSVALSNIIKKLDTLDISNIKTDIKGDAFEYFIQKYNSGNKDLGEYFTPRHIVNFLVKAANVKYGEKIYDPFCGTGGMLISSFAYIYNDLKNKNILSQAVLEDLQKNTLYGSEKTATAKIAKMNMILTGDGHSNIKQQDTFVNPVSDKFDVVITNIPFSQEGTGAEFYDIQTKSGDSQAIQHILKSLKKNITSRAFVIVPEGVLNNSKLKDLRKKLVSENHLQGVISLPCGAFLPYTEAKTSILCLKKQCDNKKMFFYNVENDGYTLTTRRRKLDGITDFDEFIALNCLEEGNKPEHEKITWVEKSRILKKNITLLSFKYNQVLKPGNIWLSDIIRETKEKNKEHFPTATVSNETYWGIPLGEEYWGDNFISVTSEKNTNYKVVRKHQFAYNPSRINVGSVVMNTSDVAVSVSSAYTTFEVYNKNYLPEYIYLLLRHSGVSLEIKNRSFGTVRQTLSFEDLSTIQFKDVSLPEQKKAVKKYVTSFNAFSKAKKEMDTFTL